MISDEQSRTQIPGDDLGRSWVAAAVTEPHDYDGFLLTLVTTTHEDSLVVVGNAFIIYAHEHGALCLSAAHNFSFIKSMQSNRSFRTHPTLPPDFKFKGTEDLKTDRCFGIWVSNGQPFVCKVGKINYIENYDVAIFTVHSDDAAPIFTTRAALDLRMPNVGDEVAVLAHKLSVQSDHENVGALTRELVFHFGIVSSPVVFRDRMGQSFSFETTIPIFQGISGGPILRKPEVGGTLTVCGVASFDFSEDNSFQNFMIPGRSSIASIWPAMGLGFEMSIGVGDERATLLSDLLHKKFLDDRSAKIQIEVAHADGKLNISYIDEMFCPPNRILLETSGHPLFH